MIRNVVAAALVACVSLSVLSTPARAQAVITKESAAELKASFLADLETMRDKFVGLAGAFPQDKYTWRPMEGVRSVSEVLMLIATEGYGFAPTSLGGKAALSREEMGKLVGGPDSHGTWLGRFSGARNRRYRPEAARYGSGDP